MAEGSDSSDDFDPSLYDEIIYAQGYCMAYQECDSILGDNVNLYKRFINRFVKRPDRSDRTSILDNFTYEDRIRNNIEDTCPEMREFTVINENGYIRLDLDKVEKKRNEPEFSEFRCRAEKGSDEKIWKELDLKYAKYYRKPDKFSDSDSEIDEETEDMNKPWNRKARLRRMYKRVYEPKKKTKCSEKDAGTCKDSLDINIASELLRVIAVPSMYKTLCSLKFVDGAFAEDEDDVDISEERFDFINESLEINILEQVQSENFDTFASDLENDPRINGMVPSILEFLQSDATFQFLNECLTLILVILKNPYRNIEFTFEEGSTYGNQQIVVAEYLLNCLQHTCTGVKKPPISDKCTETIIMFAKLHVSNLAIIVAGFDVLLNAHEGEGAYHVYCEVLNVVTSVGIIMIESLLPLHFEKIYSVAVNDTNDITNRNLYSQLLRAAEILLQNFVENYSFVEDKSSENNLDLFYATCYSLFERELSTHLRLKYELLEERKRKFEGLLVAKHGIFKSKDGLKYENLLATSNRRPIPQVSEGFRVSDPSQNSDVPLVFVAPIIRPRITAGDICSNLSVRQLGFKNQVDISNLKKKDTEHLAFVEKFPRSYFDDINDHLKPKLNKKLSNNLFDVY